MEIKMKREPDEKEQTKNALADEMLELDDDTLSQTSGGAGNPFADLPRVPTKLIDDDLRSNG